MAVPVKGKVIEYDIKINDKGLLQVSSASGKLRAAFSDLGGAIKAISADIDRQTAAHGRTVSVVQSEINAFNQLAVQYRNQPVQLDAIRQKLNQLELEYVQLDAAARQSASSMNANISNAGLAGAVLTEFNRTVSDVNYGFRAVANNLSQLSTLFITLQSKTTESAYGMGRFGGTLKMLWGQLNGPLGVILALQVVITTIEKFSLRTKEAENATADFNKELLLQVKVFEGIKAIYDDTNTSLEQRLSLLGLVSSVDKDFREALERGNRTDEEKIRLGNEYFKIQKELSSLEDQRSKLSAQLDANKVQEFLTQEELNKQLEVANLLQQSAAIEYRNQGRELASALEPLVKFYNTTKELTDVNQQLIDTQKQINDLLGVNKEAAEGTVAYYENIIKKEQELLDNTLITSLARMAAEQRIEEARENIERITGEKRKKNAKEVADFIKDLAEDVITSGLKREEDKLRHQKEKEIERLKSINATDSEIAKASSLYDQLILQATKERIQKEIEEEEKAAKQRERWEEATNERIAKKREEAKKANVKKLNEYFKEEIDKVKELSDKMVEAFSTLNDVLGELGKASEARFERQIGQLNQERDTIRANSNLTQEQKQIELQRILDAENVLQEKRIKNERNFLMVKQTLALSEMLLKTKMAAQERLLILQNQAMVAKTLGAEMSAEAAASIGKSKMSIGEYVSQLGPLGIVAFALSIGGIIASIVSARRQAQAEIASLTRVSVGGGGGASTAPAAIQAPDFNVVGASAQNQLAQAIAGKEQQPIKAYVVSDDVTSAQELDRKIVEGASI